MFLHSGASLHGHEYSARGSSQQPQKHMPLLRSALRPRPLSDTDARSLRQDPSLQSFSPDQLPLDDFAQPSPPLRRRTAPYSPLKRDLSVRFRDQIMDHYDETPSTPASEDEESVAGSEFSDVTETSTRRRRQKRAPRQSTRFALAHPAPQLRTKQRRLVQIRPRLLLQLQQLGDKRAIPAFDVVPSSLVAGSIIIPRLAKRFPRVFRAKPELGHNDVLIVRSEDYDSPNAESSREAHDDDDGLDHRDVLGVISTLPTTKCVEIVMEDGSTWTANPMATGSYEFNGVDSQGNATTARWIKKSVTPSRRNSAPVGALPAAPEYKWTFSIIDPTTKRHPIMGSIRSGTLEIFDTYNTMSASSGRFPPTRAFGPDTTGTRSPRASIQEERTTVAVSEEHKKLMLATGLFVSLRQDGWPASTSPKMARVSAHCRSASSGVPGRSRGASSKNDSPASSRPSSPRAAADSPATTSPEMGAAVPVAAGPQRAMSSGEAYMRKRRMTLGAEKDASPIEAPPVRRQHRDDGKTPTCGTNVRLLAQKLFHRKSWQRHQKDMLKYKLDE